MHGQTSYSLIIRIVSLLALVFLTGCASYRLGDPAPTPFRTLYIQPASNQSFAPMAIASISTEIREAFIRDGRVSIVVGEDRADAVLSIDLTDYRRNAVSRDTNDTVRARDFNIQQQATLSLYDNRNGGFYFKDRPITANTSAYVSNPYIESGITGDDYRNAEASAVARLARDIGRQAADNVLNNW